MDTQKVRSIVGNAVVGVGDVVLFTPYNDVVVCNPKFESALAIVDYVSDNRNEVCLHTFDNRSFQAIKVNYIKVLDYQDVNMIIDEAKGFYDKVYWKPNLQIVIDLMEDFDDLLDRCRLDPVYDEERIPVPDDFGALCYDVGLLIETICYQREEGWTCDDLEILNNMYRYLDILRDWWR